MFVKLNANSVQSDEGYRFSITGRDRLEYAEGDHLLSLGSEFLTFPDGKHGRAVYLSGPKAWQPPHDKDPLDVARIDEIRKRIEEALKFLGVQPEFH